MPSKPIAKSTFQAFHTLFQFGFSIQWASGNNKKTAISQRVNVSWIGESSVTTYLPNI